MVKYSKKFIDKMIMLEPEDDKLDTTTRINNLMQFAQKGQAIIQQVRKCCDRLSCQLTYYILHFS